MQRSSPVDGFSLAYDRTGAGPPVMLLHGWPGTRSDFRALAPLLADAMDVVVPDLRGFGASDKHAVEPRDGYAAAAQARSVVGLMEELALDPVVLAGYDIGSRIAQTIARSAPERVRALVIAPPLPGAGERVLTPGATSLAERTPQPAERITRPTRVLWPAHDPLFPPAWGDLLDAYFTRVTVTQVPGAGHFSPLETPQAFAAAIREATCVTPCTTR